MVAFTNHNKFVQFYARLVNARNPVLFSDPGTHHARSAAPSYDNFLCLGGKDVDLALFTSVA